MTHKLSPLPYPSNALQPFLSEETIEFHYGKHHRGYVEKLNSLIKGTGFEKLSLEETILRSEGKVYNNAAQVWNHDFFWRCMSPKHQQQSSANLDDTLGAQFGSTEAFLTKFKETGVELFGSGYVWLVINPEGRLQLQSKKDAENPLSDGGWPLLCCDVWEHAYYIDYRNDRAKYMDGFLDRVNWSFVLKNFQSYQIKKDDQTYRLAI